jgi:hypothetical protein
MRAVRAVIRNIREFLSDNLRIAWNSCIPQFELSFSRETLIGLFGGTCIPKVRDYIYSQPEIAVAKANGWAWCALVNTYGSFGHILSYAFATLKSGAFCSGNDKERAWAYVKYDPIGV